MYEFKLFISGETDRTRKILADLGSFLTAEFGREYNLRVTDVIKDPQMAQEDGILATPTLVKANPPMKRIIGDLSDMGIVLERLCIHPPPNHPALMKESKDGLGKHED